MPRRPRRDRGEPEREPDAPVEEAVDTDPAPVEDPPPAPPAEPDARGWRLVFHPRNENGFHHLDAERSALPPYIGREDGPVGVITPCPPGVEWRHLVLHRKDADTPFPGSDTFNGRVLALGLGTNPDLLVVTLDQRAYETLTGEGAP